jgi:hypothetical protein
MPHRWATRAKDLPVGEHEEPDATVRTKRLSLLAALVALIAVGAPASVMAMLYAVQGHPVAWLAYALFFPAIVGLFKAWTDLWREERGHLRADETGLWLGERSVIRREEVRHAYVLRRCARICVRFGRRIWPVEVEVADEAGGEALLAAMRLDAGSSVGQYAMTHGTWRTSFLRAAASTLPVLIAPGVALLVGGALPLLLPSLLVGSALTCLVAINLKVAVSIGADGIRLRRPLSKARFVPFAAIAGASTDGTDVAIQLHDGEVLRVHSAAGANRKRHGFFKAPIALSDRAHEGDKLVERIRAQLAARRGRTNAEAPSFARAGRETEAWLREIRAATDANASYRTAAVPPEELWRIVEDAAAAPTARAGAAAALRDVLDDPGRVRLRAAADACAGPRLRVALETVASEEDADLHGAFAHLDDHDSPKPRGESQSGKLLQMTPRR